MFDGTRELRGTQRYGVKIIEYEQICTYGLDSYKMGLVIIISDSKIVTREVLLVSLSLAQVKQQID